VPQIAEEHEDLPSILQTIAFEQRKC